MKMTKSESMQTSSMLKVGNLLLGKKHKLDHKCLSQRLYCINFMTVRL